MLYHSHALAMPPDTRHSSAVMEEGVDQILTSSYNLKQVRKISMNGIRGWERKLERARREDRRVFRTSDDSLSGRIKKKTKWYRKKRKRKESRRPSSTDWSKYEY